MIGPGGTPWNQDLPGCVSKQRGQERGDLLAVTNHVNTVKHLISSAENEGLLILDHASIEPCDQLFREELIISLFALMVP